MDYTHAAVRIVNLLNVEVSFKALQVPAVVVYCPERNDFRHYGKSKMKLQIAVKYFELFQKPFHSIRKLSLTVIYLVFQDNTYAWYNK